MKTIRFFLLLLPFLVCSEADAQKIDRERTTVKYIQLPMQPLPESIKTYKTVFRTGMLMPDEKQSLENQYLKLDGYTRTQRNPDLRVELTIYGINLVSFEVVEEEVSRKRDGETYRFDRFSYEITYTFPTRLDVLTNNCERFLEEDIFPDDERFTLTFGDNEDYRSAEQLKRAFAEERFEFFKDIEESRTREVLNKSRDMIQDNFAYLKTSDRVMFITGKGKKHDYSELDRALKHAERGLGLISSKADEASIKAEFTKAIEIWEEDLKNADFKDKKARINKKIAGYLHFNCAQAFMWMNDFENAKKHAVEASINEKSGSRGRGIRDEINDREKRWRANEGRKIPD